MNIKQTIFLSMLLFFCLTKALMDDSQHVRVTGRLCAVWERQQFFMRQREGTITFWFDNDDGEPHHTHILHPEKKVVHLDIDGEKNRRLYIKAEYRRPQSSGGRIYKKGRGRFMARPGQTLYLKCNNNGKIVRE